MAKTAGMKYIVITTKHHDGFCMWDSAATDYDIVDRTPHKKDVIKMLAEECQRQGIALGLYYSHLDWHHPDYFPRGDTGQHTGRPEAGDFNKYLDYMNRQIVELASGAYGPVSSFWFDGVWDHVTGIDWRLKETYDLIHRLLPHSMIGNNRAPDPFRSQMPKDGEDFQIFEGHLPGHGSQAGTGLRPAFPLETCKTMNNTWGYNVSDRDFSSVPELVHYLVRTAGLGANLLLNVGPPPDGTFESEVIARLQSMGQWTAQHGQTIYGTRAGPMAARSWGVMTQTQDGKRSYLHLLKPGGMTTLEVPVTGDITGVTLESTGAPVVFQLGQHLTLPLAGVPLDPVDTIFVIEHRTRLQPVKLVIGPNAQNEILLDASSAVLKGQLRVEDRSNSIELWLQPSDLASWFLRVDRPGRYRVVLDLACAPSDAGNTYTLSVGGQQLQGTVASTGSWTQFNKVELGTVELASAPEAELIIKPLSLRTDTGLMNLRSVKLIPM